jgi:hypothetical protein
VGAGKSSLEIQTANLMVSSSANCGGSFLSQAKSTQDHTQEDVSGDIFPNSRVDFKQVLRRPSELATVTRDLNHPGGCALSILEICKPRMSQP